VLAMTGEFDLVARGGDLVIDRGSLAEGPPRGRALHRRNSSSLDA
jgi:hypothetical protein